MDDIENEALYRNIIIAVIINNAVHKIPIKTSDIIEILEKESRVFNHCFPLAREALHSFYGIKLKEVPHSTTGKKFICYSEMPVKSLHELDAEQQSQLTLLFIILSYIFMSDVPVYETQLEDFLKNLRIYFDSDHDYFGSNIKKLITDTFVKQLYLKKEKSESEFDVELKYLYSWGLRSKVEFKKQHVLEAAAKILGEPAKHFISQYQEAYGDTVDDD